MCVFSKNAHFKVVACSSAEFQAMWLKKVRLENAFVRFGFMMQFVLERYWIMLVEIPNWAYKRIPLFL